jgi:two-component system, cell cycle sensor histidine kinase and response regulator CckA
VTTSLNVLLVEDSPSDAKLVLQELRKLGRPIESVRVEDDPALRDALTERRWDLILCDWSMPRFSARSALATLKALELDVPFVIVSGTVGEESAVEAMRAGADDYVLKDKLGRLIPVVERELREAAERAARQLVEAALRASEARFARLASSGIVGIVFADLDGNVFDANEAYLGMLGFSREDVAAGRLRWTELIPPEWQESTSRAIEEIRTTGAAVPREQELFRKDGTRIPVLQGAALLDYPKVVGFVVDMTRQRRAEQAEALRAEEAKLEHAGRARAEEALKRSEEQLRHAQKMEAVGRLAGGVAHDFNNVLSIILSYAEVLLETFRPGDPVHDDIDEIRKAALRAAGLTRQLLLFSRQQVTTPKVVDLNDVLSAMSKMLQRILAEDVAFAFLPEASLGRVRVDPGHIEQVIMNLAVNARDAMPTGGKLTIETANVVLDESFAEAHLPAQPGRFVMLAVSDTGIGMDRATQARIFEPFFTTKPKGQGTGLGLSTVFGIVQQSGGTVFVYSEPGRGTTFKIYLPRVDAGLETARPTASPTTLKGSETILLVEDEDPVRAIAGSSLRRFGYQVLMARNAGEALLLCETHAGPIHILVTDVVMPQMSGPELATRIIATRPQTKVLCMSGYTDDSIVRHGVLDTSVAYLQKPFTPQSLATKVREVLDGTSS